MRAYEKSQPRAARVEMPIKPIEGVGHVKSTWTEYNSETKLTRECVDVEKGSSVGLEYRWRLGNDLWLPMSV